MLAAIVREAQAAGVRCEWEKANDLLLMLESALAVARDPGSGGVYHLTQKDLDSVHAVMDAVMPDDQARAPVGSAHELIMRRLLHGGELALIHTKAGGEIKYCAVALELESV